MELLQSFRNGHANEREPPRNRNEQSKKQRWIELRVPKAETRVVLFTAEGDEKRIGSFMNMSYACDDIDKTYKELSARGVEFEGPPQKQPWGTYAMFNDSEGNRFVVSS